MRTNYPEKFKLFETAGGVLLSPGSLEDLLVGMEVGQHTEIWIYIDYIKLTVYRLDDDFYAQSITWLVCGQTLSPWTVCMINEAMQYYYAGLIWALAEM